MKVSQMAENLIASEIITLSNSIKAKMAAGASIYNLTIGDFNSELFPIPEELRQNIIQAYQDGHTNYPMANGMPELRQAVADFVKREQGITYDADEVLIASGGRPLIFSAFMALVDPGDKVIYPVPSWNNNHYGYITEAEKIEVETAPEDNFMPDAELLAPYVEGATLLALCSPLNPTGTVFSREQLSGICEMVLAENARRGPDEKPLYVFFDQIYSNLVYNGQHLNPVMLYPEMRPYTIMMDGMSKGFCGTGLRVGWGFGPRHVIDKMKAICTHTGTWAAKAEQIATAQYLNDADAVDAFSQDLHVKLKTRLDGFYAGILSMKDAGLPVDAITPQAALYLTVKIDARGYSTADGNLLDTYAKVQEYVLNEAGVALVPFNCFGATDTPWCRLSVGTVAMDDIPAITNRLQTALSKLTQAAVTEA
ncbi:MAG: pyridoxal phosphate-dependent aminotransferase [Bacteroidia bacterium]